MLWKRVGRRTLERRYPRTDKRIIGRLTRHGKDAWTWAIFVGETVNAGTEDRRGALRFEAGSLEHVTLWWAMRLCWAEMARTSLAIPRPEGWQE